MANENEGLMSKKFFSFLLSEVTWKVLIGIVMVLGLKYDKVDPWVAGIVIALILVAGFVEVGYILGQASLDKFLRLSEIATKSADVGADFAAQGITLTHHAAPVVAPVGAPVVPEVVPPVAAPVVAPVAPVVAVVEPVVVPEPVAPVVAPEPVVVAEEPVVSDPVEPTPEPTPEPTKEVEV